MLLSSLYIRELSADRAISKKWGAPHYMSSFRRIPYVWRGIASEATVLSTGTALGMAVASQAYFCARNDLRANF